MKNREFDIIFTFYGNDEGTIYGLVYNNTDCFLPINEYCFGLVLRINGRIRPVNGGLEVLEIEQKKNQNTFESEHYKINSNSGVKRKKNEMVVKKIRHYLL